MNALEVVNATFKAIEDQDWKAVDRLISDDFQFVGPLPQPVGKAEFVDLHRAMLAGIPDWQFNPSGLKMDGERVTGNVQVGGTHKGTLRLPGMPEIAATNKRVKNPVETISFVVTDGKMVRLEVSKVPGGGVTGIVEKLGVTVRR